MIEDQRSILCIGQLVADVVVRPVDSLPARGRAELVDELQLVAGGCAANTACVLAKLGMHTRVVGVVGRDHLGDAVLADIARCGVDVAHVTREDSVPTSAVIVLVDRRGERSFLYREGGNGKLAIEMLPDGIMEEVDFVHIGGAMKLTGLDLAALLTRAKDAGCVTSLDTDWDPSGSWLRLLQPALAKVDYLLTNQEEGRMLAGIDDPWQIGARLLDEGPSAVVVKQGKSGAVAVSTPGMLQVPAFGVPVVDTTCAGDAFAAGFLFALVQGWKLEAAVKFANATGALCVTQISHRGITSLSAVHEFLQERLGETAASRLFFRAKGSTS